MLGLSPQPRATWDRELARVPGPIVHRVGADPTRAELCRLVGSGLEPLGAHIDVKLAYYRVIDEARRWLACSQGGGKTLVVRLDGTEQRELVSLPHLAPVAITSEGGRTSRAWPRSARHVDERHPRLRPPAPRALAVRVGRAARRRLGRLCLARGRSTGAAREPGRHPGSTVPLRGGLALARAIGEEGLRGAHGLGPPRRHDPRARGARGDAASDPRRARRTGAPLPRRRVESPRSAKR
jgi:hypothetical protein